MFILFPRLFLFWIFLQVVLHSTFYGDENKEFNVKSAARDFKSYVKDNEDLLSADLVRSTSWLLVLFVCCHAGFYFEYLTSLFWSFVFRSWCLYSSLWFYQRIGKWATIPYMSWIGTEVALTSLTLYLIRRTTVLRRTPITKTARRLWVTFIICTGLIFLHLCFCFFLDLKMCGFFSFFTDL